MRLNHVAILLVLAGCQLPRVDASSQKIISPDGEDTGSPSLFPGVVWFGNRCSGALISPSHVLTAAHCVNNPEAGRGAVTFGGDQLNSRPEFSREVVDCQWLPDYAGTTPSTTCGPTSLAENDHQAIQNDLAILTLDAPVPAAWSGLPEATPFHETATATPSAGTEVTQIGFGLLIAAASDRLNPVYGAKVRRYENIAIDNHYVGPFGELLQYTYGSDPVATNGDSGGPTVLAGTATATRAETIVGVHSVQHVPFGAVEPDYGDDVSTGAAAVQAFITAAIDSEPDGRLDYHCPLDSTPRGFSLAATPSNDPDGDGYLDATEDNCPGVYNPCQTDFDADGHGNACDQCPRDGTISGAPSTDADEDGVDDSCDNCPTYNPIQRDIDADGIGDVCDACQGTFGGAESDPDSDGDGYKDACDTCPAVYNPLQTDTEGGAYGDGTGDVCDICPADMDVLQANSNEDAEVAHLLTLGADVGPRGSCRTTADCSSGEACARHRCWPVFDSTVAVTCTSNADCAVGFRCQGRCTPDLRGDACDSVPVARTILGESESPLGGGGATFQTDAMVTTGIVADEDSPQFRTGYRFCECPNATGDDPGVRAACAADFGCTVAANVVYDQVTESAVWRWMTVDDPATSSSEPAASEFLHDYGEVPRPPDFTPSWRFKDDVARWGGVTNIPGQPFADTTFAGIVWSRTVGTASSAFTAPDSELAHNYYAGPVSSSTAREPLPCVDVLGPAMFVPNCLACGSMLPNPFFAISRGGCNGPGPFISAGAERWEGFAIPGLANLDPAAVSFRLWITPSESMLSWGELGIHAVSPLESLAIAPDNEGSLAVTSVDFDVCNRRSGCSVDGSGFALSAREGLFWVVRGQDSLVASIGGDGPHNVSAFTNVSDVVWYRATYSPVLRAVLVARDAGDGVLAVEAVPINGDDSYELVQLGEFADSYGFLAADDTGLWVGLSGRDEYRVVRLEFLGASVAPTGVVTASGALADPAFRMASAVVSAGGVSFPVSHSWVDNGGTLLVDIQSTASDEVAAVRFTELTPCTTIGACLSL